MKKLRIIESEDRTAFTSIMNGYLEKGCEVLNTYSQARDGGIMYVGFILTEEPDGT